MKEKEIVLKSKRKAKVVKSSIQPTLEAATAYQKIYDYFNRELFEPIFGSPLPNPILNFSRARRAAAFFSPDSWHDPVTKETLCEISLVPEWTARDPREVLSSLVHEMAHFQDHVSGTSAKNGYHGRGWFKIMARLGLPGKPHGRSMIAVSHEIDEVGAFAKAYARMDASLVLPFVTTRPAQSTAARPTLQGKRVRYECPVHGTVVRGRSGLNLTCGDCKQQYVETGF